MLAVGASFFTRKSVSVDVDNGNVIGVPCKNIWVDRCGALYHDASNLELSDDGMTMIGLLTTDGSNKSQTCCQLCLLYTSPSPRDS